MQVTYSIWGMPALRLKALRLRQEVAAISPAMQEVLAPQLKAYLMQLIRQAGEADLYAVAADMLEEFQQLVPAVGSGGGGCEIGGKRVSSMSRFLRCCCHCRVMVHPLLHSSSSSSSSSQHRQGSTTA